MERVFDRNGIGGSMPWSRVSVSVERPLRKSVKRARANALS